MPSIMARDVPAQQIIDPQKVQWTHSLLLEVNFTIKDRNFVAHLTMLMPEDGIEKIRGIVDEFIAAFLSPSMSEGATSSSLPKSSLNGSMSASLC